MEFAETLLRWYDRNARQLPWRETRNPYKVWLSEVILQQTRVVQGLSYYDRFLCNYPTVQALAAAEEDDVLRLWQGLGYYSRARNLHRAARIIADVGVFPKTYDELRRLPGVGDYTAAAIASLAYGLPYAVVDGNVYRVLARYFGIRTPIDSTAGKKQFAELAQELLDIKNPARYNQAIMDFGALQCTPQAPHCDTCPLMNSCSAWADRCVETLPLKSKRTSQRSRYFVYVYLRVFRNSVPYIYLHRRSGDDIWHGLYEPLMCESDHAATLPEITNALHLPLDTTFRPVTMGMKHILTHQRITADCYLAETATTTKLPDYQLIPETERNQYAVPRLVSLLYERIDRMLYA